MYQWRRQWWGVGRGGGGGWRWQWYKASHAVVLTLSMGVELATTVLESADVPVASAWLCAMACYMAHQVKWVGAAPIREGKCRGRAYTTRTNTIFRELSVTRSCVQEIPLRQYGVAGRGESIIWSAYLANKWG